MSLSFHISWASNQSMVFVTQKSYKTYAWLLPITYSLEKHLSILSSMHYFVQVHFENSTKCNLFYNLFQSIHIFTLD